jgi:glycosyltransferase involved in cell wall biosynthesis
MTPFPSADRRPEIWLSIVTIVKDDPRGFAKTLNSILSQDFSGVEWVIIDSSAQKTEIPESLARVPSTWKVNYLHEAPRGIYPAMNSGLARCSGEYAYFLNAGDSLFDAGVLARVREVLRSHPVWAHGPVAIREEDGSIVITPEWSFEIERKRSFAGGHFPAHQGTFAQVEELRNAGGFDPSYRIAADYAMFLKLSLVAPPCEIPFQIAIFNSGGVSSQQWQESFREFHRARREILKPRGLSSLKEQWETRRHFALVYAHREVRPRLSWGNKQNP